MINIISQFPIIKIHFAKSMDSINVCLKNQSVILHNTITIVETIHVCMHHIRTHRLTHVQIQNKFIVANIEANIHLGDSYMLSEKNTWNQKNS
jgi:hypothetical protein